MKIIDCCLLCCHNKTLAWILARRWTLAYWQIEFACEIAINNTAIRRVSSSASCYLKNNNNNNKIQKKNIPPSLRLQQQPNEFNSIRISKVFSAWFYFTCNEVLCKPLCLHGFRLHFVLETVFLLNDLIHLCCVYKYTLLALLNRVIFLL